MIQPLALVLYEKLLPGNRLVNRLQDLKYRVETVSDPKSLVACAQQEKPMLVLLGLDPARSDLVEAIGLLKKDPATEHVPVIAFTPEDAPSLEESARQAGAAVVASESAITSHLPQLLDRALHVE